MHVDHAIQDNNDFRAAIDMPMMGLVGPVQPDNGAPDPRTVQVAPIRPPAYFRFCLRAR